MPRLPDDQTPIDDNNVRPRTDPEDVMNATSAYEVPSSTRNPPRRNGPRSDRSGYHSGMNGSSPQMTPENESRILDHSFSIQNEHWLKSYWRPGMGWLYMLICFVDFVVFPALTMILPAILKGFSVDMQYQPWQSLTLSNGGLVHIAFGAILGVAAWSRGREKMIGANENDSSRY